MTALWVETLLAIVIISYVPFGLFQMYLVLRSVFLTRGLETKQYPPLEKKNNVIVVTTTNGMATDVVQWMIKQTDSYGLGVKQFVVKEERDQFKYGCGEITVPKDYKTKNGSRNKMRALQYGIEKLHEMGYGKETYIVWQDDDSLVSKRYIEYVMNHLTEGGAQGCITLREWGHSLISSFADIVRVSNCETWCKRYNIKGTPVFVHGEGLVVRADINYEIGWDFATYGAEDLMMGLEVAKKDKFGYIPWGHVAIAPPTTAKDFYKQRRRWFWSIFKNDGKLAKLSRWTWFMYVYMYFVGITGMIGFVLLFYSLFFQPELWYWLWPLWVTNLICFFAFYQYGAWHLGSKKIAVTMIILMFPVAFFEGCTILYALIKKPDFTTFETIKKV
jgi:cellulose synthase/poly-beta-1,6-N-acetylglucosamine synthase-like glycosyltransferase